MKIRNGFVSNSSSSSFVVLGVKFEATNEDNLSDIWNWEDGDMRCLCDDGVYYKGYVLGESDCDFMESAEYDWHDVGNMVNNIVKVLDVDEYDVKLYVGTRSC